MKRDKPDAYQKGWVEFYKQSLKNSAKNMPEQYKSGYAEFYKLRFKVTPDVLIPRPETELLIDEVLSCIKYKVSCIKGKEIIVLDVGTGSGAIAVSLAKNTPNIKIIASDISSKALKIAKLNAKLHGVENKITFVQSNLLSKIQHTLIPKPYTLVIVTNLPYIPTSRIACLDSSVKDFEPFIALDGGEDGFELYRKLLSQIVKKNWKPKLIVGEIDYTQGKIAVSEGQKYFPEATVEVKKDLAHLERILIIKQ